MQTLQTLSQKLAQKMPKLSDYACNLNADKLAIIDMYLAQIGKPETEELQDLKSWLEGIREELKLQGEALWIKNADVLTNLGLKLGKTGVKEFNASATSEE